MTEKDSKAQQNQDRAAGFKIISGMIFGLLLIPIYYLIGDSVAFAAHEKWGVEADTIKAVAVILGIACIAVSAYQIGRIRR